MAITTSDSSLSPNLGGKSRSRPVCWVCGKYDKVYTIHPAYGYRVCRACVSSEGIKQAPIWPVEEETGASEA
jgi:hypothetical protein